MDYSEFTAAILQWLYPQAENGIDYRVDSNAGIINISFWNASLLGPQPTPEDIAAQELPWRKSMLRAENKAWVTAINGRCWEHATGDDFDDVIAAMRTATRTMVNNYAIEAGLTPRVSAAEAKAAYSAAAPEFDLIPKAKEARGLMADEIAAITDAAAAAAYQVGDAKAGAVHAAAYPTASPTLAELLVQFPVREE